MKRVWEQIKLHGLRMHKGWGRGRGMGQKLKIAKCRRTRLQFYRTGSIFGGTFRLGKVKLCESVQVFCVEVPPNLDKSFVVSVGKSSSPSH